MDQSKVKIVYNGVNHEIEGRHIIKTGLYADNCKLGKDFFWNGSYSQDYFSNFLKMLENPGYKGEIRNPYMICLLRDWDCSEMIEKLIRKVKSELDHSIIHNGFQYRVNLQYFSSISQYFCSQIELSFDTVLNVNDEFSEDVFGMFLDCIHGIQSLPSDERLVDIYQLCLCWKCNDFLGFINTESIDFIINSLIKGDNFEQKVIEENATHHIHSLVQEHRFYNLSLSTLNRIVSRSNLCERIESLQLFVQNVFKNHGVEAFSLIFSLDFTSLSEEKLIQILENLTNNYNSSFFHIMKDQLIKEMKKNQDKIKDLEVMNSKLEEQNFLYEEEKKKSLFLTTIINGKWKSTKDKDFESDIFEAAAKGKLTSIIYLLANGANVNTKYPNGYYDGLWMKNSTPIHFSSRYGHLEVVQYLVKKKAEINIQEGECLFGSPLHFASSAGHLNVVEFLISHKALINSKALGYPNGFPLHYAAEKGHLNVIKHLINKKTEINIKDSRTNR